MLDDLYNEGTYSIIPLTPMEKLKKSLKALQANSSQGGDSDVNPPICADEDEGDKSDDGASSAELGNSPKPSLNKRKKKTNEQSIDFKM